MPILIKEYEFQEDEEHLFLTIKLNGQNPKNVDIYCNDSYLKINFSPFFFELDFFDKVDEDTSSANISQKDIKFSIKKETSKLWGRASLFTDEEKSTPENKELIKKRRAEAFDRSLEKIKEKQKQKRIFINNQKREMVQKQMDVEKAEREKIKEIKNKAAEEAKKDLYSWINNEKQENPKFINFRKRYQDNDEGRIREIDSDEEEEEEEEKIEDDEIDANIDIWDDQDNVIEYNDNEELESSLDPWEKENKDELNDFIKQNQKLDTLAKRRRNKKNQKNISSLKQNNHEKEVLREEKPEEKDWERLTEAQITEENDPVVTEENDNTTLQSQPITETPKEANINQYKGKVLEDISDFNSDEDEDEFDMEAIQAKVRKELQRKTEKELEEKLGKRYYRMSKASTERKLPPPRAINQHINITFTPRDRPTAARESEDEKYRNHMKRQRAIKASLDKLHDSKGIQEESAVYLKEKGNVFYKHEDYEGAINAYTSALELEPENIGCLSNRSACYLKMKKFEECLKDCDKAITTLKTIKDEFEHGACNAEPIRIPFTRTHELALMKLLIRRGATQVANKKYQEALNDYTEALEFDKHNETIIHDIEQIKKAINF
ncbi:hypothetical protein BCR36DRAFT_336063 [Piromyces finnis]|uniref:CS domain-containing protein n=1 Tax=Piromyces finnis TaxID=1754191 RepID=A0A1Y1UYK8_9FUNG|nr:hypothetical protein BCR36DRAFT_336063 [Piromyces finnis]|eukprot:ORX43412.1 hypothetical protein BCR36DRAFT_336063 [Piromyces finnis]